MKWIQVSVCALLFSASAFSQAITGPQAITGLTGAGPSSKLNQKFIASRPALPHRKAAAKAHPDVVVFSGDTVFAQLVDGGSWKTAFYFVNLESHSTSFQVLFLNDDGTDMYLPVVGVGNVRGVNVNLYSAGTVEFESVGSAYNLAQGWAYISSTTNDSVGASAVFRQSVPGFQAQEAVVPVVNQYEDHFVLVYDNTSYVTGIAIANPTANSVVIPVNIHSSDGSLIDKQVISLRPYAHTAFTVANLWPSTYGRLGAIEFLTSGFGVGALGLRFNGQAFTSFSVLENSNWVVP
jgi:hypothetical protein